MTAIQDLRASGATVDSATGDQQFDALTKYGQDLTAKVATLDPVIGRDEEIRRVVRVLCRRTKNNPILIGEPGVGKTAIAGTTHVLSIFLPILKYNGYTFTADLRS